MRRGVTLIELLVVVMVLMIIAAATVPRMRPMMETQRTREAARVLHLYLSGARNRAVATGRPCGIQLDRLSGATTCAMTLSQVEVPPSLAGSDLNSCATVSASSGQVNVTLTPAICFLGQCPVAQGDLIQFNYQGPWHMIQTVNSSAGSISGLTVTPDLSQGNSLPWTGTQTQGVLYRILRHPMKGTAAALQLPTPAVIDLNYSGTESQTWGGMTGPLIITFSPNGGLGQIYANGQLTQVALTEPIYLLVGKREKVGLASGNTNLDDIMSLWVAVNPRTGLVTTTDNYIPSGNSANLFTSRNYARQSDMMRGR